MLDLNTYYDPGYLRRFLDTKVNASPVPAPPPAALYWAITLLDYNPAFLHLQVNSRWKSLEWPGREIPPVEWVNLIKTPSGEMLIRRDLCSQLTGGDDYGLPLTHRIGGNFYYPLPLVIDPLVESLEEPPPGSAGSLRAARWLSRRNEAVICFLLDHIKRRA